MKVHGLGLIAVSIISMLFGKDITFAVFGVPVGICLMAAKEVGEYETDDFE